ncbi:hypothetical protein ABIA70_003537 [Arthrobacter sp. 754]
MNKGICRQASAGPLADFDRSPAGGGIMHAINSLTV